VKKEIDSVSKNKSGLRKLQERKEGKDERELKETFGDSQGKGDFGIDTKDEVEEKILLSLREVQQETR